MLNAGCCGSGRTARPPWKSGVGSQKPGDATGTYLQDLWRFDTATDRWTNETSRVVGAWPAPREWSQTWTDGAGSLWLFAGTGFAASLLAMALSFVPPGQIAVGSPAAYIGLLAGGAVLFIALPMAIYALRKPHWHRPDAGFEPFSRRDNWRFGRLRQFNGVRTYHVLEVCWYREAGMVKYSW